MRVLFIHPPSTYNLNYVSHAGIVLPSGIATLAAWLRREFAGTDLKIEVIEGHARNLSIEQIVEEATREPWDAYIFSYWTAHAMQAYAISDRLRKIRPGIPIIHGGVHATMVSEDVMPHADYIVCGEGEITLTHLLKVLEAKEDPEQVEGIIYQKDGRLKKTPDRPLIEDLDQVPYPAYDLLEMDIYFRQIGENIMHVIGGPRFPIYPSRGCPFNCAYCCSPTMWRRRVRWRTPSNVIGEMKKCIQDYGISSFHFWDDNSLLNPDWMESFCREVIDENLVINWVALTRAETIIKNKHLLGLMKQAGCLGLEIGVESTSEKALEAMEKGQTLKEIEEALRLQRDAGLHALYTLMAFSPGEDLTSFLVQNRTMEKYFNCSRFPAVYVGQFATTYPGTKFYQEAPTMGKILARDWNDHHHDTVNFAPTSLLADIPLKTRKWLSFPGALIALSAMFRVRYVAFDLSQGSSRLRRNLFSHWRRLWWFYRNCNGKKSIEELSSEMRKKFNLEEFEGIRFCCVSSLLLACMGLIKSAANPYRVIPTDREMFMFYLSNLFQPHYLKTLGRMVYRALVPRNEPRSRKS